MHPYNNLSLISKITLQFLLLKVLVITSHQSNFILASCLNSSLSSFCFPCCSFLFGNCHFFTSESESLLINPSMCSSPKWMQEQHLATHAYKSFQYVKPWLPMYWLPWEWHLPAFLTQQHCSPTWEPMAFSPSCWENWRITVNPSWAEPFPNAWAELLGAGVIFTIFNNK